MQVAYLGILDESRKGAAGPETHFLCKKSKRSGVDSYKNNWAVLSDEQMSKRWPFSLLNNEQMSNWLGVEHQPDKLFGKYQFSRSLQN